MKGIRTIKSITKGKPAVDGAGVKLTRVLGYYETNDYDPFLMLDSFDSTDPNDYIKGFPWHPHRGIETITYLVEGIVEHGDSLGNKGVIRGGDCQWMTAGSGIIHQEMPKPSNRLYGAQLWLNLPKEHKMTDPAYGDIIKENVPVVEEETTKIHIISGEYKGIKGGFQGKYVNATYLDVELEPGQVWTNETPTNHTVFIFLLEGEAILEKKIEAKTAVLFEPGELFQVKAGKKKLRFLYLCAPRLDEPIAWGGPIVMNTREELRQAFRDLDNNTFLKNR